MRFSKAVRDARSFVPFVSEILVIVLIFKHSQPGDNKYGPNPERELPDQIIEPVADLYTRETKVDTRRPYV